MKSHGLGVLAVSTLAFLTMAVAFCFHAFLRGDPFVAMAGGPSFELAALYFSVALLLMAMGPGRFSLDRKVFGPKRFRLNRSQ